MSVQPHLHCPPKSSISESVCCPQRRPVGTLPSTGSLQVSLFESDSKSRSKAFCCGGLYFNAWSTHIQRIFKTLISHRCCSRSTRTIDVAERNASNSCDLDFAPRASKVKLATQRMPPELKAISSTDFGQRRTPKAKTKRRPNGFRGPHVSHNQNRSVQKW